MSNLDNAHTIRFLKYLVPVFTFSVTFNVPKFLEATLLYDNRTGDPNQPFLTVTELRLSPEYSIVYNNWIRLVITGIIPFILLVFFNAKIYTIIRVSSDYFLVFIYLKINIASISLLVPLYLFLIFRKGERNKLKI